MKYRPLGRTGIRVSQLCLGTMMFGGKSDETESFRMIDHAIDQGVNFIDTADVYGDGRSEKFVGNFINSISERIYVATKLGRRN